MSWGITTYQSKVSVRQDPMEKKPDYSRTFNCPKKCHKQYVEGKLQLMTPSEHKPISLWLKESPCFILILKKNSLGLFYIAPLFRKCLIIQRSTTHNCYDREEPRIIAKSSENCKIRYILKVLYISNHYYNKQNNEKICPNSQNWSDCQREHKQQKL